jgi:ABC-2 type transport system permease protein
MKNIWTIAKREYDTYFNSPVAYVIAFVILLILGIYFALILQYHTQNAYQSFGSAPDMQNVSGLFGFLMVLFLPTLTMRLLADENRMGTLELLLTAPVSDAELIIGKWLGSFLFVLTIILTTLVYPIILNNLIDPGLDIPPLLSSYLGLILIAASLIGLGVGISALFSNQIAAFFGTFGVGLFLWWMIGLPAIVTPVGGEVFRYLTMENHFSSLNTGVINLSDLVYFLSLTVLGLFVGTTAVEMKRWR